MEILLGICFPMGKGLYRVVHIPEDEAILLNSREKAPYMICVEVVRSDIMRYFESVPCVNESFHELHFVKFLGVSRVVLKRYFIHFDFIF